MADEDNGADRRRHPRHDIRKPVRAKVGDRTHEAETVNISASGVALETEAEFDDEEYLDLDIEDVGFLAGSVLRSFDDGVAVRFVDIDDEEEDRLLDELAGLPREIGLAEE